MRRDSVLTLQRHLINYTAIWPVLISFNVEYLKTQFESLEKI